MDRLLLAYSGGLVNSVSIHWLKYHRKMRIYAFIANLGQQYDVEELGERALELGAEGVFILDLRKVFLEKYAFQALKVNAIYENSCFLATALSRPLIAAEMINIVQEEGIRNVAHGCVGKGNDQLRLEAAFSALAPGLRILAPRREWNFTHLNEVIEYAKRHHIMLNEDELDFKYSKDENIWGTRIAGLPLEDPDIPPPEEAYLWTKSPENAPDQHDEITIDFAKGVPVGLNSQKTDPTTLVETLNTLGSKHGIGRRDHVENRFIGAKVREVYEAPAAEILYSAHEALEKITLDRATIHFQPTIAAKFAQIVYNGFWFSKLREAINSFFEETQEQVTGSIKIKLFKGKITVLGCRSPFSLYRKDQATIEQAGEIDTEAVSGWIRLITQAQRKAAEIQLSSKSGRVQKIKKEDLEMPDNDSD